VPPTRTVPSYRTLSTRKVLLPIYDFLIQRRYSQTEQPDETGIPADRRFLVSRDEAINPHCRCGDPVIDSSWPAID
jgi:hypothetical protein